MSDFEIGKAYYFETDTLYYIGRCVKVTPMFVYLEHASWVVRTGWKSKLMENESFDPSHFTNNVPAPQIEFVGNWNVSLAQVRGWKEWDANKLPGPPSK